MNRRFVSLVSFLTVGLVSLLMLAGACAEVSPRNPVETPQWASFLPAETPLLFAIEDAESFRSILFPPDPAKAPFVSAETIIATLGDFDPKSRSGLRAGTAVVKNLLGAFKGGFVIALSENPAWPTLFFAGQLNPDTGSFSRFLSENIQPILTPLGLKWALDKDEGGDRLQVGGLVVYFATSDSRLFASTDRSAVLRAKGGPLAPEAALAGRESFRKAIALVPPRGLFAFVDLRRFVSLQFGRPSTGTCKAMSDLGLDNLESLAFSADADGSFLKLNLAVTSSREVAGLPAILLRPNTATKAANFVPPDYSLFLRWSVAGARDAYREWQAIVRRMVDDVSWQECQDALAEVNAKRGFALEDILDNLGEEVALAVKLPDLIGIPPTLALVAVKDEAKALDVISRALTKAGAKPQVFNNASSAPVYTTTLVPGVLVSYTTKDGYLIVGLSPTSIESALAASSSRESLASQPRFASAIAAAPDENLFFAYADMQRVTAFLATLVHWFESNFQAMFRAILLNVDYSPQTAEIVGMLNREAKRMGDALIYETSGRDYVSAHIEIPLGAIRCIASLLKQPLAKAAQKAERAACMSNLEQIAAACHMYANDHGDKFPDRLSQLEQYVEPVSVFSCPSAGSAVSRLEDVDSKSSYKLVGGFLLKDVKEPARRLILYESLENHRDGANVAFADCHVEWVSAETLRELQKQAGL